MKGPFVTGVTVALPFVIACSFCAQGRADTVPTLVVDSLTASVTPSSVFYAGSGSGFSFSGGGRTGTSDLYPVNTPISLGFFLAGTNTVSGPPPFVVSGQVGGGFAEFFGSATVSSSVPSIVTPVTAATFTLPATVSGAFVACTAPGFQLCDTGFGAIPPNAPIAADLNVNLSGLLTVSFTPAAGGIATSVQETFAGNSVPEPATVTLLLMSICALLVVGRQRHRSTEFR